MTKTTKKKTTAKPKSQNINMLIARLKGKDIACTVKRIKKDHYNLTAVKKGKKESEQISAKIDENATKAECDDFYVKAVKTLG